MPAIVHLHHHPPPRLRHQVQYEARSFSTDVTTCPCGGRLKPLGTVLTPEDIALHLRGARASPRPSPAGKLMLLPQ
jgi:hypothetical protein